MGEHLEVFITPQVQIGVLVNGTCVTRSQLLHRQRQGLLVVLQYLRLTRVDHAADARRQDVVDRFFLVVLLEIDCAHFQHTTRFRCRSLIEGLLIGTPLSMHQVERCQTQHDGLAEACHEHSHEADGRKVRNAAFPPFILIHRDAEKIPCIVTHHAIPGLLACHALIDNVVLPHLHGIFGNADLVLIVLFVFIECEVLIDVFHIRLGLIGCAVTLGRVFAIHGVTVRVVDVFITIEDGALLAVVVGTSEIVILVGRRGEQDGVVNLRAHLCLYRCQKLGIGRIGFLLLRSKSVKAHVLFVTGTAGRVECVSHRILRGHTSPNRFRVLGRVIVNGQAAFVEFLTVLEHILTDFAQVEIQIATEGAAFIACFDERVEHPELNILDIRRFKVRGFQFAHHAAPAFLGIKQVPVSVKRRIQVVRTTLIGIIGQVQHAQGVGLLHIDAFVGKELALVHLAHIGVGKLFQVALDMTRRKAGRSAREKRVDIIPGQKGTVIAITDIAGQLGLAEHGGYAGNVPLLRIGNVYLTLGVFKVIDIRSVPLRTLAFTRNKLGKLGCEIDARRCGAVQQRQFVEPVCEALALLLPGKVQPPKRVVQRFGTHGHLGGERFLAEVHESTSHLEILGEVIREVQAEHGFALHTIVRVTLQADVHTGARIQNALVENFNDARIIVHGIIGTFHQGLASSSNDHRTARNIHGSQLDFVIARSLVFAGNEELVFLGNLPGNGSR